MSGYSWSLPSFDTKDLEGKEFTKVENFNDEELRFYVDDNNYYVFYHYQDCCENVWIEDVNGDLEDLVGTPILLAEERSENTCVGDESATYTFYTFRTIKGSVDVRWCGLSNGYYSESVDKAHIIDGKKCKW